MLPTPTFDDSTRDRVLEAAFDAFTGYGYRRASVEEIARTAGLSRTAVYNHFDSKETLFVELVTRLHGVAEGVARSALDDLRQGTSTLEKALLRAVGAKLGLFFGIVNSSRHGEELLDEHGRQAGALAVTSRQRQLAILEELLAFGADSGDLSRSRMGSPRQAAEMVYLSAHGLQGEGAWKPTPDEYRERLEALCQLFLSGWSA